MSEFACRNGHLMSSGEWKCKQCGEPLYSMDDMTDSQLRRQDKYEREHGYDDEDEQKEEDEE